MKAFKAFIKPPKRSVKIKIWINFLTSSGIGAEKVDVGAFSAEIVNGISRHRSLS